MSMDGLSRTRALARVAHYLKIRRACVRALGARTHTYAYKENVL